NCHQPIEVDPQSLSVAAVQPEGQHPSPLTHVVMTAWTHAAVQVLALPVSVSVVQALPSVQLVGQLPTIAESQVSPDSTTPSPHRPTGVQVKPSPVKPLLHVQVNDPGEFEQVALALQPPLFVRHSLT